MKMTARFAKDLMGNIALLDRQVTTYKTETGNTVDPQLLKNILMNMLGADTQQFVGTNITPDSIGYSKARDLVIDDCNANSVVSMDLNSLNNNKLEELYGQPQLPEAMSESEKGGASLGTTIGRRADHFGDRSATRGPGSCHRVRF